MADSADKISQLKIDRNAPASPGRGWMWPAAARLPVAQALREL